MYSLNPYGIALSLILLPLFPSAAFAATTGSATTKSITVEAGAQDRINCIVSVPWEPTDTNQHLLEANGGRTFQLQNGGDGAAYFLLDSLSSGQSLQLTVKQQKSEEPVATAEKKGAVVELKINGKTVLNYQMADTEVPGPEVKSLYRHNSYLHPIYTPADKPVTDDYPPDHFWHRGIWLAWAHTSFNGGSPDFWNQGKGDKLIARVDFEKLESTSSGPVFCGFKSHHQFLNLGKPVLNETWELRAYSHDANSKAHIIDLVSVQNCATDQPLVLTKYHYGGLGYRGNRQWDPTVSFLSSSGETDRLKINEQRINWLSISGKTDGQLAGIALMDHPDNFRSPQPIRVNPEHPQICFAPSQLGDWKIEPGKPLTLRYRFIVADGEPDKAQLDRLWQDFAHPPKVTIH